MKILVTGGIGYIGSHTVVELLNNNYEVIVIDNLSNSKEEVVDKIKEITNKDFKFYKGDLGDYELLDKIFKEDKNVIATYGYDLTKEEECINLYNKVKEENKQSHMQLKYTVLDNTVIV